MYSKGDNDLEPDFYYIPNNLISKSKQELILSQRHGCNIELDAVTYKAYEPFYKSILKGKEIEELLMLMWGHDAE